MKKRAKKLVLAKETVRDLGETVLAKVEGAATGVACSGTIVACTSAKYCPNMPVTD